MKIIRKAGATSNILQIFVRDSSSTTGAGLAALTNATSGLTAYYHRDGDTTATVISLVTMTVGTFTSSGFKEIDATNMPGWYQFCPPDAAFSTGKSVAFHLKGATNMAPLPIEVDLWVVDPQSAAFGLSLAKTTNITGFNDIAATAVVSSGAITTSGGAVSTVTTVTNQLTAAAIATGVWQDSTAADFTTASSIGKALYIANVVPGAAGGHFIAGTNAATTITTALTANITGNLSGSVGSVTGAVGSVTASYMTTGTATAGATDSITLAAGASATNGLYDPGVILITSGTGAGQARTILDYNGTSKVATVDRDWRTNPDATSVYYIYPVSNLLSTNEGLAQAGAASTITLNSSASAVNNTYNGQIINIRGGTGQDQARIVTGYVGATKVATVDSAWATNPDSTSIYMVLPIGYLDATISSRMATYTQPSGFLAATFPTGTIANTTNITAGTITTATNLTNAPTAGDFTATMKTSLNASTPASVTTVTGNVNGSVGSVTGAVTVGTNNDKTGYALSSAGIGSIFTTSMTESYAALNAALTPAQALYAINQQLGQQSITGTTMTVKKRDQVAVAKTYTLNDATTPTAITEAS